MNLVYMGNCIVKLKRLDALWQSMKMDGTMTPEVSGGQHILIYLIWIQLWLIDFHCVNEGPGGSFQLWGAKGNRR